MRCKTGHKGARAGFSLIEVATAVVLFTIIVSGVLASQAASINLTYTARDTSIATADAQAALEEMLSLPAGAIPGQYPDGAAIPRFDDLHLFQEQVVVSYPDPGANPLEIQVVVSWIDFGGRPRSIEVNTLKGQ